MAIYRKRHGAQAYGQAIGVMMLEFAECRVPGDMGNASSYARPALFRTVEGGLVERVAAGDPGLIGPMVEAARWLERQGVRAITSNCGFMGHFQEPVAEAVGVPVALSSLIQLPFLAASVPGRPVGIITAFSDKLDPDVIRRMGIACERPIRIAGMQDRPEFRSGVLEGRGTLDTELLRDELVEAAAELMAAEPGLGAILLECAIFPAHAAVVQQATGLPVFDFMSLADYLLDGTHARDYGSEC